MILSSTRSRIDEIISIGSGKTMVVFFSVPSSTSVCRYRNCSAIGSFWITAAAMLSFSAALYSPSALMILARRSRSASAWRAIARIIDSAKSTCFTSTIVTFTPQETYAGRASTAVVR